MIPLLAMAVVAIGILILYRLDRGHADVSKAIWVPFVWILITSSRPITAWLSAPTGGGNEYIDGSPLDRNVWTLLLVLGLYIVSTRSRQAVAILRANPTILIYFALCLISLLWADYPFVVFKRWIRSVGDVVMVLIILTERNRLDALKVILSRIAYLVVPISILFIRFYPSLGRSYSRGGVPEWTGVGTDKNALGMICMIYGVCLLWRWIGTYSMRKSRRRSRSLIVMGAVLAMILYLLYVVDSQTALSCFVMANILIVMTARSAAFRKPRVLTFVVVGMVAFCFSVLILGVGGVLLKLLGRNPTLTGRTEVWQTLIPHAVNPWIGAGYENFWIGERMELFIRLLGGLNQAHNGYIEIYLNLGLLGLALLAGIIVVGYTNILKEFQRDREAASLKVAFFVICLIYNLTEASFKMTCPVWITFLWAVMIVPAPRVKRGQLAEAQHPERAAVVQSHWDDAEPGTEIQVHSKLMRIAFPAGL